ncbi:MAG: tetratricopeptide repeat protein, partial [Opitutales bacterium]
SLIELGQLDQAAEYLDKNPFTSTELPSWWRAEWNLIAALKESSGSAKAFRRVQFTLENSGDKLPREALIRLTWLKAQISLDLKEINETPDLVDKVIQLIENSPALDKKQFDQVLAQAMLTKGQAFLRMKEVNESFAVFEEIRVKYPKTNQAALSYLLEANHHSVNNHLAEAQSNLVTLAERFPDSEYAPRALYEASITAERRGLPESQEEAVRLLEHLAKRFPNSDLLFYARLRQGHMLRNLNDFGAALEVYDEILRNEILSQHPHRALSSLSRADCLFAIARTDSSKILEAADRYSDLFISVSLPVDLRVEAGCKRALCLRKANKLESAKAACWEIIRLVVEENESLGNLGGKGRYWASRSILELGDMLERENSSKKAFEVYALIRKYGLPGEALATSRAGRKKE